MRRLAGSNNITVSGTKASIASKATCRAYNVGRKAITTDKNADPVWKPPSAAASNAAKAFAKELKIERLIKAPREQVWAAWTDARQLAQWWGPHGFTNPVCEIDPTVGGLLHIVMRGPDGVEYVNKGVVRSIIPLSYLEFTVSLKEPDGSDRLENLTERTLKESDGCTRLLLRVRVLTETPAAHENIAGMDAGWNESIDRLESLVVAVSLPHFER